MEVGCDSNGLDLVATCKTLMGDCMSNVDRPSYDDSIISLNRN